MKNYLITITIISVFCLNSCEKTVIAYPGNNQDQDPKPPQGDIEWALDDIDDKGQLEENSAPGLTIGTLNATDPNPDDEFTYILSSQKIVDNPVNYFTLSTNAGVTNLELANGSINYEALTGSKQVDVVISVTDDSPEPQTSDFSLAIEVINVNETPYFTNTSSIVRYADEYIEYNNNNNRIEWTDTDEGDNPTLTSSDVPGWLTIDSEGQMSGTPGHGDIGNASFVLTLTDEDGLEATEDITINVRENQAPDFTNTGSIPTLMRVGCYADGQTIVDINWIDPNGSIDNVTFTHQGTESVEWLTFDDNADNGVLFCNRAPENGDAGTFPIVMTVRDDRPSVADSSVYLFDLDLRANDAPEFTNLGDFPGTVAVGDTLERDVDWQDANSDLITFSVTENYSWFDWDNSGNITATPLSSHVGTYEIPFSISDGCYINTQTITLTVE